MASNVTLSESQQAAVDAPWENKISLVLSTAGSGKTLVLTKRTVRIAKQLANRNIRNKPILCICFNVSAAEEMYARISHLICIEGLSQKVYVTRKTQTLDSMVTIEVRTFHGLGLWIIRSSVTAQRELIGLYSGNIKVMTGKDLNQVVQAALIEAGVANMSQISAAFTRQMGTAFRQQKREVCDLLCAQKLLAEAKNADELPTDFKTKHYGDQEAFHLYEQRLAELNAIDLDDMITKAIQLLLESPQVRDRVAKRYSSVLVDEFQDMSASNLMLCRMLVSVSNSMTLVGDDDQQIYSFRMMEGWFCHEVVESVFSKDTQHFTLPENRRCSGAIVKAANSVIQRNSRRYYKNIFAIRMQGLPVHIVGCQSMKLEIKFVIQEVKKLLTDVIDTGSQILILFRINSLLADFEEALNTADILTSRKLTDSRKTKAEGIGSKTLAVFSLLSLISGDVKKATFIWAAGTVCPTLDAQIFEEILKDESTGTDGDSKAENIAAQNPGTVKHLSTQGKEEPQGTASSRSARSDGEDPVFGESVNTKGYPSKFLESVRTWFDHKKKTVQNFKDSSVFEPLHMLLSLTDNLLLKMNHLTKMEDIVQSAEQVLSSPSIGIFEVTPAQDDEVDSDFTALTETELAGYNVIISTARKIDDSCIISSSKDCKSETKDSPTTDNADDTEDFTALFSQDSRARARKRRKKQGVKSVSRRITESGSQGGSMGTKISKLCSEVTNKLKIIDDTMSELSYQRKLSDAHVVLSTIHKAKGSTFPHVFLCGANSDNIPNGMQHQSCDRMQIDLQSSKCQEERRMFFVAMTRAQQTFTCTYSNNDYSTNHPKGYQSPFIAELLHGLEGDKESVVESFIRMKNDIQAIST